MPTLSIDIEARFAKFQDTLDQVSRSTKRAADGMTAAFDGMRQTLQLVGVGLSVSYFKGLIDSAIETQDKLYDLNVTTGASVDKLEQMRQVAQVSGTAFDGVGEAMAKLARNMSGSGAETKVTTQALEFLNIKSKDAAGNFRDTADVMKEIAVKLGEYADGAGKTAIVQDLLGKNSAALLPYLKELADSTERTTNVTAESVQAAHDFTVAMRELKIASEQSWLELANNLLPTLINLVKTFNDLKAAGGWKGVFSGVDELLGQADPIGVMVAKLDALKKTRDEFAGMGAIKRFFSADDIAIVNSQIDLLTKKIETARTVLANQASALPALTDPSLTTPKAPSLNYNRGDPTAAAAELKLYTHALQALELELSGVTDKSEVQKVIYETTEGSLTKLTLTHKAYLLSVAGEVDIFKKGFLVANSYVEALKEYTAAEEAANHVLTSFNETNSKAQQDAEFALTLVGKTAFEIEKLTEIRRLDLATKAEQAKIDPARFAEDFRAVAEQGKIATQQMLDSMEALRAKTRDWATGAKSAFDEYIDHATNAAEQSKELFTNAFKSIEDALVSLTMTGKLDFKTLADSIISDLIRIQIRKTMAEAVKALEGTGAAAAIGNLFGWGNNSVPNAPENSVPNMGMDWAGAFAAGTDYVPRTGLALLHQGEAVIPAAQNRGGMPAVAINVVNQGLPLSAQASQPRFDGSKWVIDVLLEQMNRNQGLRNTLRSALSAPG